jgi:5-methylcytosine-specific restriction endonuclease McrA
MGSGTGCVNGATTGVLANPQEERERHRETTSRRRARLSQASVGDREALRNYMRIIDGDPCSYCGVASDSVDHIIPLSRGGGHSWDNLTAACIRCNSGKFNLPLLQFLRYAPQTGHGEEPDR